MSEMYKYIELPQDVKDKRDKVYSALKECGVVNFEFTLIWKEVENGDEHYKDFYSEMGNSDSIDNFNTYSVWLEDKQKKIDRLVKSRKDYADEVENFTKELQELGYFA